MNKVILGFLSGALVGSIVTYFVVKKKFDKSLSDKIKAIAETNEAVRDLRNKKGGPDKTDEEVEDTDEDEDINGHVDISKLSEEEIANGEAEDYWDELEHITDDEDEDGLYEDDEEQELRLAREAFAKEIEEYVGSGRPYNITAEMYDEPYEGFAKSSCVINEDEDRAYDGNTGEEIEDWREVIGVDFGTIDDNKKDDSGRIFVRSERNATDYEITYSQFDWIG